MRASRREVRTDELPHSYDGLALHGPGQPEAFGQPDRAELEAASPEHLVHPSPMMNSVLPPRLSITRWRCSCTRAPPAARTKRMSRASSAPDTTATCTPASSNASPHELAAVLRLAHRARGDRHDPPHHDFPRLAGTARSASSPRSIASAPVAHVTGARAEAHDLLLTVDHLEPLLPVGRPPTTRWMEFVPMSMAASGSSDGRRAPRAHPTGRFEIYSTSLINR